MTGATPPRDRAALRRDARAIWDAGVEAADARRAVAAALVPAPGGGLVLAGEAVPAARVRVLAVGKAACAMAQAVPPGAFAGPALAVTIPEAVRPVPRFAVRAGAHPLPDGTSAAAAEAAERLLAGLRDGDGLLLLLSGGASALLAAPAPGLDLGDLVAVNRLLLASGAAIGEVNAVRKHLSRLKGGLLARAAGGARVEVLLVSDVPGDDPAAIGSGPAAPDPTTLDDAREVLARYGLLDAVPDAVLRHLDDPAAETPKPGDPAFARVVHRVVASRATAVAGALARARALGYAAEEAPPLAGEAREAAARLAAAPAGPGVARVAAGEAPVTVRGGGRGGRCQELALAFALAAEQAGRPGPWALCAAGTDGRDGPTDAAGALVDDGSLARARTAGADPPAALADNDTHAAHRAAGDLVRTGPTGTNVADLAVLLG